MFRHALVNAFVAAANQQQLASLGELAREALIEFPALSRE
jgi:hypothetical protein